MKSATPKKNQVLKRVCIFSKQSNSSVLVSLKSTWKSIDDLIHFTLSELNLPKDVEYSLVLKRNRARITSLSALRDEDDLNLVESSSLPKKSLNHIPTLSADESDFESGNTMTDESSSENTDSPQSEAQTAVWQQKFRKMARRCKNYTTEARSYERPISIIENYFFGKEPPAHPAIVASFVVLAQNFVPLTVTQIVDEATEDGYLLKKDSDFDIFATIQEEIDSLKSKAFFTIVDDLKIGLSPYGQEVVDSIDNLKFLIGLLCKKFNNNHNVAIDVHKYCENNSSPEKNSNDDDNMMIENKSEPKRKRTLSIPVTPKKKKNSETPKVPLRKKSKKIKEETSENSYQSSPKDQPTKAMTRSKAALNDSTVWINGIPADWRDNFFVKKKVMNAIKSKFDKITINSLAKDVESESWILILSSNTESQSMIGQSLYIIEGTTTQHTLTFITPPH